MTLTHTAAPTDDLAAFTEEVDALVNSHPVVTDNAYTRWFAKGEATAEEVRHLTVQFSVFSHLFVEAQMRKVINAADIDTYRTGKEILMNELGVVFKAATPDAGATDGVDPDLVSTEGTVDGGRFKFAAAHFEWLVRFGKPLGLEFAAMGKRRHGTDSTLFFCEELLRIYGSEDASEAEGASYAVEHWAAAGFWKELIAGLTSFKERECAELPLAFWTWHDKVEDQHAAHTTDELAEAFHLPGFDRAVFLRASVEMLDGVKAFWDGLEADRLAGPDEQVVDMVATHTPLRTPTPITFFAGWDHLEFWVGNARQAAGFLSSAFGYTIAAYAGPETGLTDRCSWLLTQGDIRLVVTGGLGPDSPVAAHHRAHGDGVRDMAIRVTDVEAAYEAALERCAVGLRAPWSESDEFGTVSRATIATYGDTQHTFVGREGYTGPFLPGFDTENLPPAPAGRPVGLGRIDHVVGNVEKGQLVSWVDFYGGVLGFDELVHFDDAQITTEYSALMSTVVWDGSKVVLPINEPADGKKKSQIQEYLDFYGCPGVQHIAMRTDDIVAAVSALRDRGVRFLRVPDSYYSEAKERMAGIDLPWGDLQRLGILVDRDHDGHLLQVFTETVTDRPTVFFEIIQREGAKGFGEGNFKALFEAIEREQDRRGNL